MNTYFSTPLFSFQVYTCFVLSLPSLLSFSSSPIIMYPNPLSLLSSSFLLSSSSLSITIHPLLSPPSPSHPPSQVHQRMYKLFWQQRHCHYWSEVLRNQHSSLMDELTNKVSATHLLNMCSLWKVETVSSPCSVVQPDSKWNEKWLDTTYNHIMSA